MDVYGNHLLFVQKGMPSLSDIDKMVVVKERLRGVHVHGQLRLGKDEIQQGHDFLVVRQLQRMLSGQGAEVGQDFLDLFLFLQLQLPETVVQLHDGRRLDEIGGSGGGLVVDHAVYLRLVFRLDGNAVAVAPHGDDGVLQVGAVGAAEHIGELGVYLVVGLDHSPPDALELGACVVCDLLLGEDAVVDLIGHLSQRG